jgi:multimeric flavodoxin WrbA
VVIDGSREEDRSMKKVTAFVGSARKKHTYNAARQFLNNLQSLGDVESEVVVLSDYRLGICRGCKVCFDKGEEFCPFKDDRDLLLEKIAASDGVIFASPIYSFQVSAIMKIFLDRLGFVFHRPRFFGKTFTTIVVQGIYGGSKIVKYLDFVGNGLGFDTLKGSVIVSLEPMTDTQQKKNETVLARQSREFYERLMHPALPTPTLFKLMIFRMGRTSLKQILDDSWRDYVYYRDKGWFESDYYYPTRLGVPKKAVGRLFDSIARRRARKR